MYLVAAQNKTQKYNFSIIAIFSGKIWDSKDIKSLSVYISILQRAVMIFFWMIYILWPTFCMRVISMIPKKFYKQQLIRMLSLYFGSMPRSPEVGDLFQTSKDHMMFYALLLNNSLCLVVSMETYNSPIIVKVSKLVPHRFLHFQSVTYTAVKVIFCKKAHHSWFYTS